MQQDQPRVTITAPQGANREGVGVLKIANRADSHRSKSSYGWILGVGAAISVLAALIVIANWPAKTSNSNATNPATTNGVKSPENTSPAPTAPVR